MSDWDTIVIGAGGAGLAAAVSAAERGAKVIIFEAEAEIGGSTQLSAGMFTAADTSVQAEIGIDDNVDRFYQHYMDLNRWNLNPGLVRRFCEQAGPTLEWLMSLGVEIPAKLSANAHDPGITQAGVEDVWRGHVPKDQGFGIIQVLDRRRRALNIDLALDTRVDELLIDDGRVTGVKADGIDVDAKSVIVASGGFAHNHKLLEEYYPEALDAGSDLFVVAAPGSRGDHIKIGKSVDAEIAGEGWGLLLVTSYLQRLHHWQSGFPPKSRIYINSNGERFMNEDISYAVSSGIVRDNGGKVWNIFDENGRRSLPEGYAHWNADLVADEAASGRLPSANTLSELAALIDVPKSRFQYEVDVWNEQLPAGNDERFLRHVSLENKSVKDRVEPIRQPPFYAARTSPAELVCTHAGLSIDRNSAVRRSSGGIVPGLFAAGEAGAGILGERYVGGGNSVANALTMGRIAGINAAT